MNNARWLLLIPLLISLICLAGAAYVSAIARRVHPESLRPEKFLRWHQAQMASGDPQVLRRHAAKIWEELANSDDRTLQNLKYLTDAVSAVIWVSAANLVVCTAAFYAAKDKRAIDQL